MEKNYNTSRGKLQLPEYGRNILQMIDALKKIEDRDKRSEQAKVIIDVMGNINPTLRDSTDYKHKIWDHLFIIADFNLDIDCPYDIPTRESYNVAPDRIKYPKRNFSHKQYGNNIRQVFNTVTKYKNKELVDRVMVDIAKFMKNKSYEYNKEYPSDDVILNDMRKFSDNDFYVDDNVMNGARIVINRNNNNRNQKQKNTNNRNNQNNSKQYKQNKYRTNK